MKNKIVCSKNGLTRFLAAGCMVPMILLITCSNTGTAPTAHDVDGLVIEAYLYAGQPVSDVRIVHLQKIIYDTAVMVPVSGSPGDSTLQIDTLFRDSTFNNATVTITTNGATYPLTSQDSGYYADVSGKLTVTVGQTYRINVSAGGYNASAQTTVPSPISGLSVSRDTIYVATRTSGFGGGGRGAGGTTTTTTTTTLADSLTNMTIHWNNQSSAYLYYRCLLDTVAGRGANFARNGNYTSADSVQVSSSRAGNVGRGFQTNQVTTVLALTAVGPYKILVYSTTPDYQRMLNSMADTTSQNQWNESPTNVTNGFGFFTAFSIDSTFFNIATAASN